MEEQFLNDIGKYLVYRIRKEIKTPRMRFSKSPRRMKPHSPYNMNASGALWNSVSYKVRQGYEQLEIDILMNDYGVNNVFNADPELGGSFPGGGLYAKPRPKSQSQKYSALIDALTKWAQAKLGLPTAQAKGMAFAVRRNMFKYGWAGVELYTDQFVDDVNNYVEKKLLEPQYEGLIIGDILDRINRYGNEEYKLIIGI